MKIYTEVVYTWDDTKEELVKESSKSFDYHGPLALCWVQFIPAIIAGVQLAITVYGAYKGQQAAEEAARAEAARRANLKRLAIKKFKHQQGTAAWNLSNLDRQEQRDRDIEKNVLLTETIKKKKIEGTIKANGGMYGQSSDFYMDRISGDLLRGMDAYKEDFLFKRIEIQTKGESVMRGLRTDRINMQYGIAGLTPPSTPDKSLMWLQMGNAALDAYGTYWKYSKPKVDSNIYGYDADTSSSVYGMETV